MVVVVVYKPILVLSFDFGQADVKQKNNSNKPSANQTPVNTQDEAMNNDALQNDKDDESAYEYFKCQQSCPALQKVFSSIDELELHTKYFHTPSPCRDQ